MRIRYNMKRINTRAARPSENSSGESDDDPYETIAPIKFSLLTRSRICTIPPSPRWNHNIWHSNGDGGNKPHRPTDS